MSEQPHDYSNHSSLGGIERGISNNDSQIIDECKNKSSNSSNYTSAYVRKTAKLYGSINGSNTSINNYDSNKETQKADTRNASVRVYTRKATVTTNKINPTANKLMSSLEYQSNNEPLSVNSQDSRSNHRSMTINHSVTKPIGGISRNNIPNMTAVKPKNVTKKDNKAKQSTFKKNTSDYERLIDIFSDLIATGTRDSVYFLEKDVLNSLSGISTETFQMEKMMKINEFCKEVENLEMEVAKIQNFQQMKNKQNLKLNTEIIVEEDLDRLEDINLNVLKIASERRISVYDYFFESIIENLNEVVYVATQLKEDKKPPIIKEEIAFNYRKTNSNLSIDESESLNNTFENEYSKDDVSLESDIFEFSKQVEVEEEKIRSININITADLAKKLSTIKNDENELEKVSEKSKTIITKKDEKKPIIQPISPEFKAKLLNLKNNEIEEDPFNYVDESDQIDLAYITQQLKIEREPSQKKHTVSNFKTRLLNLKNNEDEIENNKMAYTSRKEEEIFLNIELVPVNVITRDFTFKSKDSETEQNVIAYESKKEEETPVDLKNTLINFMTYDSEMDKKENTYIFKNQEKKLSIIEPTPVDLKTRLLELKNNEEEQNDIANVSKMIEKRLSIIEKSPIDLKTRLLTLGDNEIEENPFNYVDESDQDTKVKAKKQKQEEKPEIKKQASALDFTTKLLNINNKNECEERNDENDKFYILKKDEKSDIKKHTIADFKTKLLNLKNNENPFHKDFVKKDNIEISEKEEKKQQISDFKQKLSILKNNGSESEFKLNSLSDHQSENEDKRKQSEKVYISKNKKEENKSPLVEKTADDLKTKLYSLRNNESEFVFRSNKSKENLSDNEDESDQSEILKNSSDYHNDSIVYGNLNPKLDDSSLLNDNRSDSSEATFVDLEKVDANEEKIDKTKTQQNNEKSLTLTTISKQYKKQDTIKDYLLQSYEEDSHDSFDKTIIIQYCNSDANNSMFVLDNIKRDLFYEARIEFQNKKVGE